MKTIKIKVYEFSELEKNIQDSIVEQFKNSTSVEDGWYDDIVDAWIEKLAQKGFESARVYFSGFYSQGDGACFDARINVEKFAETPEEKIIVQQILNSEMPSFNIYKTEFGNRYSHEKTRYVDYYQDFSGDCELNGDIIKFKDKIEAIRLNLSVEIYRELEKEYEHLRSDETIHEILLENSTLYYCNGEKFNFSLNSEFIEVCN
jgi:hypothetical protein